MTRPLRIFTWHVHSNYLYSLSHIPHEIFVPVKAGRPAGYAGRSSNFPWPETLHEVPAEEVRQLPLDCVLFQSTQQYLKDQYEILSPAQQRLPKIYLEHDPPGEHPTNTRHVVDDPNVLLVHVTPFNNLMWDCGRTPTWMIDHGVSIPPQVRYRGDNPRGIVVVDHLAAGGRPLGADIFLQIQQEIPLDLIGLGAKALGGLAEVPPLYVPAFIAQYRFFFNPLRYTSLNMAVCEAMMAGLPIIALGTTEMATTIENGVSGYVDTDIRRLVERMRELLAHPAEARRLGMGARRYAQQRFSLARFVREWETAFAYVMDSSLAGGARVFHSALRAPSPVALPHPEASSPAAHPATFLRGSQATRDGVVARPYRYHNGDARHDEPA